MQSGGTRTLALYSPLDPAFVGGMRSWLAGFWARYLRERDSSLTVIHAGTRPHAAHGSLSKAPFPSSIKVVELPAATIPGLPGRVPSVGALAAALRGHDVVYVDNGYAFQDIIALDAARRVDIPTVSGHHAVIRSGGLHDLAWGLVGTRAIRRFDAVHVLNEDDNAYLRSLGAHNVFTVPVSVDLDLFVPRARPSQFTAAFVGRLHHQKGVDRLAAIVSLAAERMGSDVAFAIGGAGPESALLDCIRGLPNVALMGALSPADCARTFGEAHVALVPSRYETFGIVAAEALAAGCHVIASDVAGLRDVVGGNGMLVSAPDNARAWVDAIAAARGVWRDDPRAFYDAAFAARESAVARFSFPTVAVGFDAILAAARQGISAHR
jgi:glycosyltransferase involved in cell wall biosynthesis